ncbi:hypothetical protein DGWBC_0477 [Dehalogenimonas sp. WBC-2]|nr:hypothetical protein DGWBC_0477 [Dehalogenimonas sp. WBC-2]
MMKAPPRLGNSYPDVSAILLHNTMADGQSRPMPELSGLVAKKERAKIFRWYASAVITEAYAHHLARAFSFDNEPTAARVGPLSGQGELAIDN